MPNAMGPKNAPSLANRILGWKAVRPLVIAMHERKSSSSGALVYDSN